MTANEDEIVALLKSWRSGNTAAGEALFELIHAELFKTASLLLRREREGISLATGDLVNDAILRLLQTAKINIKDRAHLLALSAHVMRNVLIDNARGKNRHKRKGVHVTLTQSQEDPAASVELLALEQALIRLKTIDPVRAAVVEMRYFGGMTIEDIAELQGVSPATVKRTWRAARLWLKDAIKNDL